MTQTSSITTRSWGNFLISKQIQAVTILLAKIFTIPTFYSVLAPPAPFSFIYVLFWIFAFYWSVVSYSFIDDGLTSRPEVGLKILGSVPFLMYFNFEFVSLFYLTYIARVFTLFLYRFVVNFIWQILQVNAYMCLW